MPEVDPAISALALWCQHRDDSGPTRTHGDTIYYAPGFDTLPIQEQTGVLAHHVMHVALRHSARAAEMAERLGDGFDRALYNLASDAIINEVLLQGGHALPRPAVRAAEVIAGLPGQSAKPAALLADWDTDRLYLALTDRQSGARAAAERYAEAQAFQPDLDAADETVGAEPETWSTRLEQAVDAARGAGTGIGAVLARFADLPERPVPWERHLRRLLVKAVSQVPRLSHKRPANRWVARDALARRSQSPEPVFEPGTARDRRRPRIVVGLDTSSSITETQVSLFAAETVSIARRSGAELRLLAFDTEIHADVLIEHTSDITELDVRQGGGTDFMPVFERAVDFDPSILVMLTDLDAPLGPQPRFPVIWAVPGVPPDPPGFGKVLRIDA